MSEASTPEPQRRPLALLAGPLLAAVILALPAPEALPPEGWRTAAVATWMAFWWITEAVPIPVTALLPLILFPFLDVLSMTDAAAPYAAEVIFLFMGGFFLAAGMESCGLHRRVALGIIQRVGLGPERLVLGFMLATAFLSMWISNTATTAMMLPIGIAVVELFRGDRPREGFTLGVALMLGIAYGASIGGVATLIGTPPNAILAGAASELLDIQLGFGQWMLLGIPVTAVMIPIVWLLLVKVLYRPGALGGDAAEILAAEIRSLGPASRAERRVAVVFIVTAAAWILRAPKVLGDVVVPGLQSLAPELRDSTIAMAASMVLFVMGRGDGSGKPLLTWSRARRIPWGVLILFGGGLSLARAMERSGLSEWIGSSVAGLGSLHPIALFGILALLFVFLTELTSNAATTTMAMPVLVGAAAAMGMAPLPFMIVATLSSSMAFMLPVATPPNAIVFGSDYLTIPQMARAGFLLNLIAVVVVSTAAWILLPFIFPT
ncbi:MAG: DASS family sodium-coupled anion symporter [Gemmatimonadales bacterium]|nr:MAG: DASS family sodium-coupled anion symporter [Gemmatimonadales bacterium]